jgi:hypothetical protein
MFTLENNALTRELSIRLNFDAPVSYQEFCENEEYSSLFESGAKAQIV